MNDEIFDLNADPSAGSMPADADIILRLAEELQSSDDTDTMMNDARELFAQKLGRAAADMDENNAPLYGAMSYFGALCGGSKMRIAFLGAPGSGCSSLVNALVGRKCVPADEDPGRGFPIELRRSDRTYVSVSFYNKPEWDSIAAASAKYQNEWTYHSSCTVYPDDEDNIADELMKWYDPLRPEYGFIQKITVGAKELPAEFPQNAVLIDAPPIAGDREFRINRIKDTADRANAVFVCMDAQKIRRIDLELLADVFSCSAYNKDKVYLMMTHWDRLREPDKDWNRLRRSLVRHLSADSFFGSEESADKRILYSAAHIYNVCREFGRAELTRIIPAAQLALNYYPPEVAVKMLVSPDELMPDLMELSNIDRARETIAAGIDADKNILLNREVGHWYAKIASMLPDTNRRIVKDEEIYADMSFEEFTEEYRRRTLQRYDTIRSVSDVPDGDEQREADEEAYKYSNTEGWV